MTAMYTWDGVSDACIIFDAVELSSAAGTTESNKMARQTENLNLQHAFLRHLKKPETVHLLLKVKVESIQREVEGSGRPLVHLSDGMTIHARLLVNLHLLCNPSLISIVFKIGADRFNSPVCSYAGISSYGWSYDMQAIVATLNHALQGAFKKPNYMAYQRYLPTGPIAFLST
ncbi:hypothetical protein J3R83DRAFT_11314 [Lanmaoa asiatica]|nr:hypothetical protein J3R83DRAFT_11314 [Lanmaoa asiatica]